MASAAYGIGKAAKDRMACDFNIELEGTGVYALSLWPFGVLTEMIDDGILKVETRIEL